jgi:Flp pilus assembly protein CpaB
MTSLVKIRIVLVIFIAISLSYVAYMILQSFKTEIDVIVAAVDIPELTLITPEMLRVEKVMLAWRDSLAPRSVPSKDRLENKLAKVSIPAGRPIDSVFDVVSLDASRMPIDSSGRPDLRAGISESYILDRAERLIAVPVDISSTFTLRETITEGTREVTQVNTKLIKGDLVDVIATYTDRDNGPASVLLAQKVQVHQVEVSEGDAFSEGLNVILRTTPDIALDITFMKNVGKIDLIMSPANPIESKTRELTISRVIDRSLAR